MKEYLIFTTIEDPSKLSELNCVCVPYKNVFVVIGGERDQQTLWKHSFEELIKVIEEADASKIKFVFYD